MTHTLESLKKILDDPSMMIVPIDQWNALNKELGDLRNRKSQRRIATQQWYETDTTKTGWDSHGWMFEDGEMTDGWELEDILHQDKFGNIWKATFVKSQANPWGTIASTLDPAAEYAKPYTFLPLTAAEIMVGIKAGQTWSNGYYTSSGCNEIGIYFDHKFGTTSVPWELVAWFIEENKIWEKL